MKPIIFKTIEDLIKDLKNQDLLTISDSQIYSYIVKCNSLEQLNNGLKKRYWHQLWLLERGYIQFKVGFKWSELLPEDWDKLLKIYPEFIKYKKL